MTTGSKEAGVPELLPARMLNEFVYCPRLFWLEWVDGEFAHSADTLEGRSVHRRVDKEGGALPDLEADEADEPDRPRVARSVMLSSERLGLIAKLDLVESGDGKVRPVDYKKGKLPEQGPWDPELIQVAAQVLLLREEGYDCDEGILYYAGSKRRAVVDVDMLLEQRVLNFIRDARAVAAGGQAPPPLVESPKCPRCSLAGICLPDEVNLISGRTDDDPRRLVPARDDARPLHVQEQGAKIGLKQGRLRVYRRTGGDEEAKIIDVSQVCLYGNVQITTQTVKALADEGIPILQHSYGGWLQAVTWGFPHKNVGLRIEQHRVAADEERSLAIARGIVEAKIRNQRTLLRRNGGPECGDALAQLELQAEAASRAASAESLLGVEGLAARIYFSMFPKMLKPEMGIEGFTFEGRNRRPPKDPVNAMLSFAYSLLVRDLYVKAWSVGFEPLLGFFHKPRYGRPALPLDLAEEFRPLIGDSVVINVVNNGEIGPSDFIRRGTGVALTEDGRRRFIMAYERRVDTMVRHPVLNYSVSYRRIFEVQARLLARHVVGELDRYEGFRTR